MARKNENPTIRIIDFMDEDSLRKLVMRLSERLGPESDGIVRGVASEKADQACEDAFWRASSSLYINPDKWCGIGTRDENGRYIDPADHAYRIVEETLRREFGDDLKNILEVSPEKAPGFLLAIADGVEDSDSVLFDEHPDMKENVAGRIRFRVGKGDLEHALDFRW